MSDFAERPRFQLGEALVSLYKSQSNAILHLIDNQDGTYSILSHIVCEHCDYCDEQGDCRGLEGMRSIPVAKENPYEDTEAAWELEMREHQGGPWL